MKEKTIDDYRREFYQVYHKEILPTLIEFEEKRKGSFSFCFFIEVIVIAAFALVFYYSLKDATDIVCQILSLILGLAAIAIPHYMNKNFIKMLKDGCMRSLTRVFGDVIWKQGEDMVLSSDLQKSELFGPFNRRATDDEFRGCYNDVNFVISETHLINQTGSGKNKRRATVFKGVVISFKFNKTIKNKTIITTKWDMNTSRTSKWMAFISLIPILAYIYVVPEKSAIIPIIIILFVVALIAIFGRNPKQEKLEKVNLEDPVFEKNFNVYSSDEVESRYLITTAFMERFNNLNTAFGARMAKCSFFDENIMFAITTYKNLFEIGNLFTRLDNPNRITEFFNEVASILTLVDYFKLDENIKL